MGIPMKIHKLVSGPLEANTYVLWDEETMEGAVIDPGQKNPELLEYLDTCPANIRYVIATHGHFDHMLYTPEVVRKTGAKVVIHKLDAAAFSDDQVNLFAVYTCRQSEHLTPDLLVEEGDTLQVGNLTLSFLNTPGHTPGSMCILVGDTMFSGDTLFHRDIGRSDLPRGNAGALQASLDKLAALPGDYRVLPVHMEETTLAYERKYNPCMRGI